MPAGRKPLPIGERKVDIRRNVSLDKEAQEGLLKVQERLQGVLGFRPNLTQTVLWLITHSEQLIPSE